MDTLINWAWKTAQGFWKAQAIQTSLLAHRSPMEVEGNFPFASPNSVLQVLKPFLETGWYIFHHCYFHEFVISEGKHDLSRNTTPMCTVVQQLESEWYTTYGIPHGFQLLNAQRPQNELLVSSGATYPLLFQCNVDPLHEVEYSRRSAHSNF